MCDKLIEKCIKEESRRALYNVIMMSIGFALVQTPLVTLVNAQKYFLDSLQKAFPDFTVNAYVSSGIFMIVFGFSNWIAPSIAKTIGPRNSLAFGAFCFALFYSQYIRPLNWVIYTTTVVMGLVTSILWVGQALYLARNSFEETITRNVGIFWGIYPVCMFVGNTYLLFTSDLDFKENSIRQKFIASLTLIGACGFITMYLASRAVLPPHEKTNPWKILKGALKLSCNKKMLLLSLTAAHAGSSFSLTTGMYSNALAYNGGFELGVYKILGTSGIILAICTITISTTVAMLGQRIEKWGRYKVLILGTVAHIVASILIPLNSPNKVTNTEDPIKEDTILNNNIYIAFSCSCLLGFGDGLYNTQLFSQLLSTFPAYATEAYSLARFIHCLFSALFYLLSFIGIYAVMGVFLVTTVLGYIGFYLVSSRTEEAANTQTETRPANLKSDIN